MAETTDTLSGLSPLDRAARALAPQPQVRFIRDPERPGAPPQERVRPPDISWEQLSDSAKDAFRAQARAVLAAIREPSEAMVKAGDAWRAHCSDTDSLFEEMIDAALAEEG